MDAVDSKTSRGAANSIDAAAELTQFLERRRAEPANRATIDAAIDTRFGRTQAVMFTDLVGFSRTVEAFGILHFLQLIQEAETLFLPLITQHGGRCIKREGDSLLALFEVPAQALACALAMNQATRNVNPGRSPEERIEVCIGLGFGRLLCIGETDAWGAELNAASKLGEEMAKGGEVLATHLFFEAVGNVDPLIHFVEHGKVFGERKAYRWVGG